MNLYDNCAYYYQYENKSEYNVNGFTVATLNHNSGEFETYEEMSESKKEFYYNEMVKDRQDFFDFCKN